MFEQTFKNIDDILHKDAGCSSELDYVEQTSWVLFLKYLDDLEKDRRTKAELAGKSYQDVISKPYKWEVWAAPKTKDGKIDHHKALTGDDLKDFVDWKLFPYLRKFRTDADSADTLEYKIGEIFSELKNKIQSGYNLREVINRIDELRFRTQSEKHEMSHLFEDKIKNMGNFTDENLLREGEKVACLYHRYYEYDFAWHRGSQYYSYKYPFYKPSGYSGKRPLRYCTSKSAFWWQGKG
jgi:type I restriction enzyme M protein